MPLGYRFFNTYYSYNMIGAAFVITSDLYQKLFSLEKSSDSYMLFIFTESIIRNELIDIV